MRTTIFVTFISVIYLLSSCCPCKKEIIVNPNPTPVDEVDPVSLNSDEWQSSPSPHTSMVKIHCKEDQFEIFERIKSYLNLKHIILTEIELQQSAVLTESESSFIVSKPTFTLEFIFTNNKVSISGSRKSQLSENLDPITPMDSEWHLIFDFKEKLETVEVLFK